MLTLSTTAMVLIGMLMAAWLAGSVWAVSTGLKMRRGAHASADRGDQLAALLASAPALPVIIRADGKLDASSRLSTWLGRDEMPVFASQLTERGSGMTPEDARALAADIGSAQRAGRSFSRPISLIGSARTLLFRGAPAGAALAGPGSVILWIFDVTESQEEIGALRSERDRLSEALRSLAGLIEAAPMPMWYRGPDLRLTLVNTAYVRAVDAQDPDQVVSDGLELVESVGDMTPMSAAASAIAADRPLTRQVPATIDGKRRMMRVVDVPLGEAGVAGYAVDMHELEEARGEYKRLVEAQRDMLDRLSAGVAQFSGDRVLRFSNESFQRIFSLRPDHLADAPEFDRVLDRMRDANRLPDHRDFPAWRTERREWFLSTEAEEENWLLPDGTHLRVFAQPLPDGGLLLIFEDRTEQVQLSSARDTLLRVRTATFDNLFEAIGVFAADGRLHIWNSRFRQLWALEEDYLAGHPRVDSLLEKVAPRLAKPQQAGIVRELVRAATIERQQRGGRVGFADGRHFEFAAIPLPDGNALFTMLDITDSRKMEQVLRDRNAALEEADQLKTAFVSNMSYELRTPLTSIAGFAEMMNAGYAGELPEAARDYVSAIVESTARLSSLIDNVLDLTQSEAGALPLDMKLVDLPVLVRAQVAKVEALAKEHEIDLVVRIDRTLGEVKGDDRRLAQAIDHLLDNAIRHSGRGARVLIHGEGDRKHARIVVSDNGPGMDAREQARVFDRLSRAERTGKGEAVGLGLPLARQLVVAHGGEMNLLSEPGQGTAVTMALPRDPARP